MECATIYSLREQIRIQILKSVFQWRFARVTKPNKFKPKIIYVLFPIFECIFSSIASTQNYISNKCMSSWQVSTSYSYWKFFNVTLFCLADYAVWPYQTTTNAIPLCCNDRCGNIDLINGVYLRKCMMLEPKSLSEILNLQSVFSLSASFLCHPIS
jgi:hypothetical protein